ncbi:MAG: hypothetical protein HWD86_05270 [Kangiellaceae bacterium]|nr:hypothetical protein [Kangiellaceae bacterium]
MNIDERIKKELEIENQQLDEILAHDSGLFGMLGNAFKGSLKRWVILINIIVLIVTAVMVWAGYHFFVATNLDDRVFWGVTLIVLAMMQISLKEWLFSEMRRNSMLREIKRLELAIEQLKQ